MNVMSFHVSDELQRKLEAFAKENGVSTEKLLADWAEHSVREHEAYLRFKELAAKGEGLREEARRLLAKARGK